MACGAGSRVWVAGVEETPSPAPGSSTGAASGRAAGEPGAAALASGPGQPEPGARTLAERAKEGCRDAFEQLVALHENQVFNFLSQFTRNRQDAEDLTQETFIKAYRSLDRYLPAFSFTPWLFTIARRTAISHFRSSVRFEELTGSEETGLENPAMLLERKDEGDSIWNLARTLKRKQWEVLWLRYGEGFSTAETARVMNTNQIHVKVLLHRARASLAGKLSARGQGPARTAFHFGKPAGPAGAAKG
jgi:RNA polymerase sigma-70 factor (ECF subfamily)